MSTVPLATVSNVSLADVVESSLASALAGHPEPCLWCGGPAVAVVTADIWSGSVSVRCAGCGSEMSGVVPRERRGARR